MKKKQQYISDILDSNVNDKYYLNTEKVRNYINSLDYSLLQSKKKDKIIKELDIPREIHNDLDRQRRIYSIPYLHPPFVS